MAVWGKIIGGMAGMAVGGPFGALLGAAAGHAVDNMRDEEHSASSVRRGGFGQAFGAAAEQARRSAFSLGVVVLSAKMAKADGHVSRAEIDAFKRVFNVPPGEMGRVGHLFDLARRTPEGYELYARQLATLFAGRPEMLEELLDALFIIALADGPLNDAERRFLERVATIFGMPDKDFQRTRASHSGDEGDPYLVLGVPAASTNEEVKAAYRRLIRENHPDTMVAKGLPEEFIAVANGKMAAINAAFDRVSRERGMK
ncbi:MAG: TerB family tellurite resistance protein [Alphaproteobacteria bacterium]